MQYTVWLLAVFPHTVKNAKHNIPYTVNYPIL